MAPKLAVIFAVFSSVILIAQGHPAQTLEADAVVVQDLPNGDVKKEFHLDKANLLEVTNADQNEVEIIHVSEADKQKQKDIVAAIVKDLQTNFTSKYQEQLKERLPGGAYPVRSLSPGNGIELNGKITGLENIKLSKAFEASANQTGSGLTAYNVKAEMEIPELIFEFDLVKYFPIDVFKLFPVRGHGKANMTAVLPLEAKTTPNSQTSTTGCVAAVDSVARADNVRVDVTFTNALGRGLQWIRDHLNLDLADSVLTNFAKTIVDVVLSILQLIICGAIEAATKAVILG